MTKEDNISIAKITSDYNGHPAYLIIVDSNGVWRMYKRLEE